MKKFVRGQVGRALSLALAVLMLLPTLLLSTTTASFAAAGGRQNILFLPMQVAASQAPDDLNVRILREVQTVLAAQGGAQVDELTRTSPLLLLARESKDRLDSVNKAALIAALGEELAAQKVIYPTEEDKATLMAAYDVATNATAEASRRIEATGYLVRVLGVDAIVYGTVDTYELTSRPQKAMVRVSATKVMVDRMGNTVPKNFTATGKSSARPDGGASSAIHESEAITNIAVLLASQVSGKAITEVPVTTTPVTTTPTSPNYTPYEYNPDIPETPAQPQVKANNSLWMLLGGGLLAALLLGSKGSTASTPPPAALAGQGLAFANADGSFDISMTLRPDQISAVDHYEIFRETVGTVARNTEGFARAPKEGTLPTSTIGRAQAIINGTTVTLRDKPADSSKLYTYFVRVILSDGTRIDITILNGDAPVPQSNTFVGAFIPPAVSILSVSNTVGSLVKVDWDFAASCDVSLVKQCQVYYRTGLQDWKPIGSLLPGTARTTTVSVSERGTFDFRVDALGDQGLKYQGAPLVKSVTITFGGDTLQPPQNVQATTIKQNGGKSASVRVTWSEPADTLVTGYRIYRLSTDAPRSKMIEIINPFGGTKLPVHVGIGSRLSGGRSRSLIRGSRAVDPAGVLITPISLPRGTTTFDDTFVVDGIAYSYQISSISTTVPGEFNSAVSNQAIVDIAPGNVTNLQAITGDRTVALTWTAPIKNADNSPISMMNRGGFKVYRLPASTQPGDPQGYTSSQIASATPLATVAWVDLQAAYTYADTTATNRVNYAYIVVPVDNASQDALAPYPFITAIPQPLANKVTITAAVAAVTAGGAAIPVTVKVTDNQNVPLPGYDVNLQFAPAVKSGVLSLTKVMTDSQGQAVLTYTPPAPKDLLGANPPVIVKIQGSTTLPNNTTVTGELPLTVNMPTPSKIVVTMSVTKIAAVPGPIAPANPEANSLTDITVKVVDAKGIVVPRQPVVLDASDKDAGYLDIGTGLYIPFMTGPTGGTTDDDGVLKFRLRAGFNKGIVTLNVQSGALQPSLVNLTVTGGTPTQVVISLANTITMRTQGVVQVFDANGNTVADTAVSITSTRGTISPTTAYTQQDGTVTFTFTPGQTDSGAARITASVGGIAGIKDVNITQADNPVLVTGTLIVGPSSTNTSMTWRILDAAGPMVNTPVNISVSNGIVHSGAATGVQISLTTNTLGQVTFQFDAPPQVGDVTLTFTDSTGTRIGNDKFITVKLPTPTALAAVVPAFPAGQSQINVDWTMANITGVTNFLLQRSLDGVVNWTDISVPVALTSYSDLGLAGGIRYYYRVRAEGAAATGYSNWTAILSAITQPLAPTNVRAVAVADTTADIAWDDVEGETGYTVQSSPDGNTWTNRISAPADAVAATITLTANTTYFIRVLAVQGAVNVPSAPAITIRTLVAATAAPAIPVLTQTVNNPIRVTWTAVVGAASYELEGRAESDVVWTSLGSVAGGITTFDDTALGTGKSVRYYYRVRTLNADNVPSPWSPVANILTLPAVPVNVSITSASDTSVAVSWDPVANITNYRVEVSTDGVTWPLPVGMTFLVPNNQQAYTVTGLLANTTYYFRVLAVNASGNAPSIVSQITTALASPAGLAVTLQTGNSVQISWTVVTGATGYEIERSVAGGPWELVGTTDTLLTINDTGLTAGVIYSYHVRATKGALLSAYCPSRSITVLGAPTNLRSTAATSSSIDFAWTGVNLATSYELYTSVDGVTWPALPTAIVPATALDMSYVLTAGVTANSSNYYRVLANDGTSKVPSVPVQIFTGPLAPTGITVAQATPQQLLVSWALVTGADEYEIYRRSDADMVWALAGSVGTGVTSYSDSNNIEPSTTYYYYVRARNNKNVWSDWSVIRSLTTSPAMPTNLRATSTTDTEVTLTWTGVTNVTRYEVEVSTDGVTWPAIPSGVTPPDTLTFTVTGLPANSIRYFRVVAVNAIGRTPSIPIQVSTALLAPTGLTVVVQPTGFVNVSWTAVVGATGYLVERSDSGGPWVVLGQTDTDIFILDDTVMPGVTYQYHVQALKGVQGSSFSPAKSVTTLAMPTGLQASNVTSTTFTLTWIGALTATSYRIESSLDGVTWAPPVLIAVVPQAVDPVSYNVTGVTANTTTYYRVVANNGTSLVASAPVRVTTGPAAPTGVTTTQTIAGQVNVAWTAVTGATLYEIERRADADLVWTVVGTAGAGATTFSDTQAVADATKYYYRVRAANTQAAFSDWSLISTLTTLPAAPTNVSATATNATDATITWNAVAGVTSYTVQVSTDGVTWPLPVGMTYSVPSTIQTYTVTGLAANTQYYIRVQSVLNTLFANSVPILVNTTLAVPTGLTVTQAAADQVTVTWTAVTGATGYTIERAIGAGPWVALGTTDTALTFTDDTVTAGITYRYHVQATKGILASAFCPAQSLTILGAPTNVVVTSTLATQAVITWDAVPTATSYRVEQSIDGGITWPTTWIEPATVLTHTVTGLTANTTYYYRVVALRGAITMPSTIVQFNTAVATPINLTVTQQANGSIAISWTAVTGATEYTLERRDGAGAFIPVATTTLTTYNDTTVVAGTTYTYHVQASKNGVNSAFTLPITITVLGSPMALLANNITSTSFQLTWIGTPTATSYRIENSADGVTWPAIPLAVVAQAADPVTYTLTGITANTTAYYRVVASDGISLMASTPIQVTTGPAAPTGVTTTQTIAGQVNVAWTAVTGATLYEIERRADADLVWTVVGTAGAGATTFSDTQAVADATKYYYRVRAANVSGAFSDWSLISTLTTLPAAPTNVSATATNATDATITWNAVAGVTSYTVQVSTDGITWPPATTYSVPSTTQTYTVTGLAANTQYYIRVQAVLGALIANSVPIQVSTTLLAPTGLTVTQAAADQVTVTWTAVTGATGYTLERATGAGPWMALATTDTALTFTDDTVTAGITYRYHVQATKGILASAFCPAQSLTILGAPANVVVTSSIATQAVITWDAVPTATSYRVEESIDGGFTWPVGRQWIEPTTVLTHTVTGLTANSTYYYRVVALRGATTMASAIVQFSTATLAPTLNVPTASVPNQVVLTWSPPVGAGQVSYVIERREAGALVWDTINTVDGAAITYTDSVNVLSGTQYFYRLASFNNGGTQSAWSPVQTVTTIPETPTNLAATVVSDTAIDLTWDAMPGAQSYRIERYLNGLPDGLPTTVAAPAVTAAVTGLLGARSYDFRIAANNAAGFSANSTFVTAVTAPNKPATVTSTIMSSTQINVTWTNVPGAAGYEIEWSSNGVSGWAPVPAGMDTTPANVTIIRDASVQPNSTYYYRVRAVGLANAMSQWTVSTAITTGPSGPVTINNATATSDTTVDIDWDPIVTATQVRIERFDIVTGTMLSTYIVPDGATTYTVTGLAAGTLHWFRLVAVNGGGGTVTSGNRSALTFPATPAGPPQATSLSATDVQVQWSNVTGEDNYEVQYSTNPTAADVVWEANSTLVPADTTTTTISALTSGTTYYFRVRAMNATGNSSWNTPVMKAVTYTEVPVLTITKSENSSQAVGTATLNWPAIAGATRYEYQRRALPGAFAAPVTVNVVAGQPVYTVVDSGLTTAPANTYEYQVRAVNLAGDGITLQNSAWSTAALALTGPTTPTLATMTVSVVPAQTGSTAIGLTWTNLIGETQYEIYTSADGVTWDIMPVGFTNTDVITFAHTPLANNTSHYYRVRGVKLVPGYVPAYSAWSDPVLASTGPAKPVIDSITSPTTSSTVLTWVTDLTAASYKVQYSATSATGPWNVVTPTFNTVGGDTEATHSAFVHPAGTALYYQIQGVNAAGAVSDWSTTKTVVTSNVDAAVEYDIAAVTPRIYYSMDTDDQLNTTTVKTSDITVTGYTDPGKTILAAGATVTVTTDKGGFQLRAGQTLSNNGKSVTGILDGAGKLTVTFRGNVNDGITTGTVDLPSAAEIGPVSMTVTCDGQVRLVTPNTMPLNLRPTLVGPPATVTMTPLSQTLEQTGNAATSFVTVTATTKDAAGQTVMDGMPLWFAQSWTAWINPANPTADQAMAAGEVRNAYGSTVNGQASAVFTSNHSGLYTVHAFALLKNADKTILDLETNLDNPVGAYTDELLPSLVPGQWVTATAQVRNLTLVYGNNWTVTANPNAINCDGTQTSKLTIVGKDEDGKKALQGVKFDVKTSLGKLVEEGGTVHDVNTMFEMTFNDKGEAYIYVRGDNAAPEVGMVTLTFDNNRPVNNISDLDNVVTFYGPTLQPQPGFTPVQATVVPANGIIRAEDDQAAVGVDNQAIVTVWLQDALGNPYPDGYSAMLLDGGIPVGGSVQLDGTVINVDFPVPFSSTVLGTHNMTVQVSGPEAAPGPGVGSYDFTIEVVGPGLAMVEPNVDPNPNAGDIVAVSAAIQDVNGNPIPNEFPVKFHLDILGLSDATLDNPDVKVFPVGGTAAVNLNTGTVGGGEQVLVTIYYDLDDDGVVDAGESLGTTAVITIN